MSTTENTSTTNTVTTSASTMTSGHTFEKLEGTGNYNNWKFAMRMSLTIEGLWNCVLGTDNDANRDQRALGKICLAVQPSCYPHVREADTAKIAWNNLQTAFEDKGLCRRLSLMRRLLRTRYEDFSSMGQYVSGLVSLAQQLADIGHKVDDEEVAVLLLGGLPAEFEPLVMGIEATHTELTSEIVKSRLLQEDYRRSDVASSEMSEAALAAKHSSKNTHRKRTVTCHHCGKAGHIRPKCPELKKERKKTNENTEAQQNPKKSGSLMLTTALSTATFDNSDWIVDSGCTTHMSMRKDWFVKYSTKDSKEITVANNQKLKSNGVGDVEVNLKDDVQKTITDVIYVPDIAANLLSVSKMTEMDLVVVFDKDKCRIYDKTECKIKGNYKVSASNVDGVYRLDQSMQPSSPQKPEVAATTLEDKATKGTPEFAALSVTKVTRDVWHRRLGHLSQASMEMLKNGLADGISFNDDEQVQHCIPCIKGKQARKAFPKGKARRAQDKLELIHSDVCGPMSVNSWGGKRYLLTFTDDFSRKSFSYLLKSKAETMSAFIEFKRLVENQTDLKIKRLRTDNGREYCNKAFNRFLRRHGIVHETTVPYNPEQNGVAERLNRTVIEKARSLLEDSGLGRRYWGEAVTTAIYLKNRSPTVAVSGATPEEIWTGAKVDVSDLRVFGCKAYAHIPKECRKKLDSKSQEYIMVGYCEHTKGYRLADPSEPGKVIKARSVIFIEDSSNVNNIDLAKEIDKLYTDYEHVVNEVPAPVVQEEPAEANDENEAEDDGQHSGEESDPESSFNENEGSVDSSESMVTAEEDEEEDATIIEIPNGPEVPERACDERPTRQRRAPKWSEDYDMSYVSLTSSQFGDEPQTYQEAISCSNASFWKQAMITEYKSLLDNNVWNLVDRPVNHNVVKCKWVYKIKKNASGDFKRFKARLVACGYSQKFGIDFNETFAPVVRHSTIRLLFAIGNQLDMDMEHLDVTTAFLNGELDEQIFMEQPSGFNNQNSDKVCLLKKSIYGLKQASRVWNQKINSVLRSIGYIQSKCEPCVYIKKEKDTLVLVALYVDDFFIFSNSKSEKKKLIDLLKSNFDVKCLGPITDCLGMRVVRNKDKGTLSLSQSQYVENLLNRFGMTEAKAAATPMAANTKLEKATTNDSEYPYQQLIGGLLYLAVCTRPDIAYVSSLLSQFNTCYDNTHWIAAKRVLRYLAGTRNLGLVFEKSEKDIEAFVDADWAGDVTDRRPYTGLVTKLGNAAISWESRKQKTVALSSAEAEYLGLSNVAKEACFLRNLIGEIFGKKKKITVFSDSQSAKGIAENSQHHRRTKHIDVRHHFVRDLIKDGVIEIKYKRTDEMVADALTKPLSSNKHNYYVTELGLKPL